MASPVTYKDWSEVPNGAVLRDEVGDVAARSGDLWAWYRVAGGWRPTEALFALDVMPSLGGRGAMSEIARLPPGPTHAQIRAAVEAVEAAERAPAPSAKPEPSPVARYATPADLPAGIFRDADGDLLVRLASGRFAWLRTSGGWREYLSTGVADVAWPVRWLASLPADTSPAGLRVAAEAAEAALPLPAPGTKIAQWADVPEGAVLLDNTGDVALRRRGGRYWIRVDGEWSASADEWRDSDPRSGGYEPYTYIGQATDAGAARALVEAHERATAPAKPTGPQVGDEVPPTEAAWLALPRGTLVYMPERSLDCRFAHVRKPEIGGLDYVDEAGSRIGNAVPWDCGENARGHVAALGVLLDDEIAAARKATLEAERVPKAPPTPRQWKAGDPVRAEDMADLPVGAVVDTRDGTRAPLLVRGERDWAWVHEPVRARSKFSPDWQGGIQIECAARGLCRGAALAGIVAPGTVGRAFDEALAAQGYGPAIAALAPQAEPQPSAPPSVRVWQIGQPVQGDWEILPVGAVVDSGDGSETPFLVRGPSGWGWASTGKHGIVWAEPGVYGVMSTPLFVSAARLVALNLDLSGTDFERDKAMRAERLRTLLELNGTHVDARGRVRQTPGATRAAPAVGDIVERWEDVPDGGVTRNRSGDLSVRLGDRRTWVRADGAWRTLTDWDFSVMSGEPTEGTRLVAIVPAPVTIERIRAAVGDPEPAAAPAPPVLDAATECARIRATRIAGLEGAFAAAAARLREVEAAWTVTKSGGIRWYRDGQGGQICAAPDMPGEDRRAKRLRARALVAEHDAKRAVALAEHNRLADLVARTRPQPRRHLHVNGVQVEVTADTVLAGLAAALRSEGYPAEVRGGVLYFDPEQWGFDPERWR